LGATPDPNEGTIAEKENPTMLEAGTQAPAFTLKDHHGDDVSLSDFEGNTVVLWFYPKADTPG
jgi:peroxiredoxin